MAAAEEDTDKEDAGKEGPAEEGTQSTVAGFRIFLKCVLLSYHTAKLSPWHKSHYRLFNIKDNNLQER